MDPAHSHRRTIDNVDDDGGDGPCFTLRRAVPGDASNGATVYLAACHAAVPDIPPLVHSDAEVRVWFQDVVLEHEVWLAEEGTELLAVMVLEEDVLGHLYVHPQRQSHGVGSALVRLAQSRRPAGLDLWTFQSNRGAQRFYERHGFVAVEWTDGSGNQERAPDVRYVWPPPAEPVSSGPALREEPEGS